MKLPVRVYTISGRYLIWKKKIKLLKLARPLPSVGKFCGKL